MSVSDGDLAAQRQFLDKEIRVVSVSDLPRAKKILDSLVADRKKIASQVSICSTLRSLGNPLNLGGFIVLPSLLRDCTRC